MDKIEEIIEASKKSPIIISGLPTSKPAKKVTFKDVKDSGTKSEPSRRAIGLAASATASQAAIKRAQQVVLQLIDNTATPEELQQLCRLISPERYEDIYVERCIAGVCGYPLCANKYQDNWGDRTYIIRNNILYDITRRRNFCSNVCFEASSLVQEQVSNMPLYVRGEVLDDELTVHVPDNTNLKGLHGDLKHIGGQTEPSKNIKHTKGKGKSSVDVIDSPRTTGDFAVAGLLTTADDGEDEIDKQTRDIPLTLVTERDETSSTDGATNNADISSADTEGCNGVRSKDNEAKLVDRTKEVDLDKGGKRKCNKKNKRKKAKTVSSNVQNLSSQFKDNLIISENGTSKSDDSKVGKSQLINLDSTSIKIESQEINVVKKDELEKPDVPNEIANNGDEMPKEVTEPTSESNNNSPAADAPPAALQLVWQVESHLKEWLGWESLVLIMGERYMKQMLHHVGLPFQPPEVQQHAQINSRYVALCQQLALQEKAEELEAEIVDSSDNKKKTKGNKSSPSMEQLQSDTRQMQLKVKAFYAGQVEVANADDDAKNEDETVLAQTQEPVFQSLPLVDKYEHNHWRRTIFMEKLHLHERTIVPCLGLRGDAMRPLLSHLVCSLRLASHNVYLRPPQWLLVLLALLKLLSVRYPVINGALTSPDVVSTELAPRLSVLGLDTGYLDRLLTFVTCTENILKVFNEDSINVAKPVSVLQSSENVALSAHNRQPLPSSDSKNDKVERHIKSDDINTIGSHLLNLKKCDETSISQSSYSGLETLD